MATLAVSAGLCVRFLMGRGVNIPPHTVLAHVSTSGPHVPLMLDLTTGRRYAIRDLAPHSDLDIAPMIVGHDGACIYTPYADWVVLYRLDDGTMTRVAGPFLRDDWVLPYRAGRMLGSWVVLSGDRRLLAADGRGDRTTLASDVVRIAACPRTDRLLALSVSGDLFWLDPRTARRHTIYRFRDPSTALFAGNADHAVVFDAGVIRVADKPGSRGVRPTHAPRRLFLFSRSVAGYTADAGKSTPVLGIDLLTGRERLLARIQGAVSATNLGQVSAAALQELQMRTPEQHLREYW